MEPAEDGPATGSVAGCAFVGISSLVSLGGSDDRVDTDDAGEITPSA